MRIKSEEYLYEEPVSSENIYDGIILHVRRDTVRLSNGNPATRELLRHGGAVCVVPVTDDGKVIMERQFRYPLNQVICEIPAGKLNSEAEDRLAGIQRELREETGYTADIWTDMGLYYPAPAYSDEKITMYLAQGLHKGQQELDPGEFLNVIPVDMKVLIRDIMNGTITDGKTQLAILKAARILGKL